LEFFLQELLGAFVAPWPEAPQMPLEPPDHQYWQAAVGYVELGMFQEANDQLENIDSLNRAAPEVLAVRIAVYHGLRKWELIQEVAKHLAAAIVRVVTDN
jgi:hypothetical protein